MPWRGMEIAVMGLGVLAFLLSAGIIAFSDGETRYGYALVAILAMSAVSWVADSRARGWALNGAACAGMALYLYLSAELSLWLVAHSVPSLL